MKLDYQIIDGKIYDRQLNEIPVDEKGIVTLIVEGKQKRFVLSKLAVWMENNIELKPAKKIRKSREAKVISQPEYLPEQKQRAARNSLTPEQRKLKKNAYMREYNAKNRPEKEKKPEKKVIRRNLGRTGLHRMKGLLAITPDGKEIAFKSRAEASRKLNIDRGGIFQVLRNEIESVKGYKFKTA